MRVLDQHAPGEQSLSDLASRAAGWIDVDSGPESGHAHLHHTVPEEEDAAATPADEDGEDADPVPVTPWSGVAVDTEPGFLDYLEYREGADDDENTADDGISSLYDD